MTPHSRTERRIARWKESRRIGHKRWVFLYGVLGWGTLTGLLVALLRSAREGQWVEPIELASTLVTLWLGGILFGQLMWSWNEKALRNYELSRAS